MRNSGVPFEISEKFRLWVLRTIAYINEYKMFDKEEEIEYDFEGSQNKVDKNFIKSELSKYENKNLKTYKILDDNLNFICKFLNLNQTERDILEFSICVRVFDNHNFFRGCRYTDKITSANLHYAIATILNLDQDAVRKALDRKSNLMSSYIFNKLCHNNYKPSIDEILDYADENFPYKMVESGTDIEYLFSYYLRKCGDCELNFSDYDYLKIDEDSLKSFVSRGLKGTNILLYGEPGTGKTEFVKMFAKSVGKSLYEIPYCDDDDFRSEKGDARFRKIKFTDKILKSHEALIMFDEVEDVFKSNDISKAMINRTLESNAVPTFWVTNNIECMDNAYIRRFDMVIEFSLPPKRKRLEIIQKYAQNHICERTAKKLAKIPQISPALISGATKVVSNIQNGDKDEIFKNLIFGNLKAQFGENFGTKKKKQKIKISPNYDIACVNSALNLTNLSTELKTAKSARICIYGPSGTGKSEFAKFLAKELGKELIIKTASDLLDAYVGATEQNIAMAFKQAKKKKAVLVFDEVDSFLQNRRGARASWEITQVNEMLTQMQDFDGIFIATTNLIDTLDEASLRRFDMKLKFDYLSAKQALRLLEKGCVAMGVKITNSAKKRLANLAFLTPGDFAAIMRAHKFAPIASADDFIDRLESEISHKNHNALAGKIGFI
ncbi:ATP-binding protein [Campylobacter sp. JMF_01 NE2]|uniref:ATP-binding protein n=1 Tax=unclassified Campylobacter TaxID=2593542 RepID=UPI0022E9B80D|nr:MULTISPECIES: ATP-binding protein [unclassified Campylobacter]MDA3052713.1 ATP-binding protein [Campylobacter sp. JMF_03 NE3]MDA3067044.1 ATP-binding protein [Campylobacter sp. JMF_01 NE2]